MEKYTKTKQNAYTYTYIYIYISMYINISTHIYIVQYIIYRFFKILIDGKKMKYIYKTVFNWAPSFSSLLVKNVVGRFAV